MSISVFAESNQYHRCQRASVSWWWGFITDLKQRRLKGESLEVIISDQAPGLVKAIRSLYPRVSHQVCTSHKANDLSQRLANKSHRSRIIADALHVFEATTATQATKRLRLFCGKWWSKEPKAARNFVKGFEHCLTYLEYPDPSCTMLKTNNPMERYHQELRRRIMPMRSFNSAKSAERITCALITYVLNQTRDVPNYEFTQSA
jgi:transposase-like protein